MDIAEATLRAVSADGLRSFVGPAVDIIPPSSVEDMKENFIGAASSFVEKRTEYHLLRLLSAGSCSTAELSDRFTQAGTSFQQAAGTLSQLDTDCTALKSKILAKAAEAETVCAEIDDAKQQLASEFTVLQSMSESVAALKSTLAPAAAVDDEDAAAAEAGMRASAVLKALHGEWSSESSGLNNTTVAIPVSCNDVHHTLNVHVKDGGRIHAATLIPDDVPISDIVSSCIALPDGDLAMRALISRTTSRVRSYIAVITHDMSQHSGITMQFEAGSPTLKAALANGVCVRVFIPFEYDAKSANYFIVHVLAGSPSTAFMAAATAKHASITTLLQSLSVV